MKNIFLFFVLACLVMSGCSAPSNLGDPSDYNRSILEKSIPDHVEGEIVDHLTRIEPVFHRGDGGQIVAIEDAIYRLEISVNGLVDIYPVTAETWATTTTGSMVKLNCTTLPCTKEE